MTDSNVLQRAKEGNPDAIAVLMNHSLKSKGMHATVQRAGDRLLVNLETATSPDQALLTKFVNQGVQSLKLETIDTVIVSGRQRGGDRPAWTSTLHLKSGTLQSGTLQGKPPQPTAPSAPPAPVAPPPVPPRHAAAPPPPPPPPTRAEAASSSAPSTVSPVSPTGVSSAENSLTPEGQTIQAIDDESTAIMGETATPGSAGGQLDEAVGSTEAAATDAPPLETPQPEPLQPKAPRTTVQANGTTTLQDEPQVSHDVQDGTVVLGIDESSDAPSAPDAGLRSPATPDMAKETHSIDGDPSESPGMVTAPSDAAPSSDEAVDAASLEEESLRPLYEYDVYADEATVTNGSEDDARADDMLAAAMLADDRQADDRQADDNGMQSRSVEPYQDSDPSDPFNVASDDAASDDAISDDAISDTDEEDDINIAESMPVVGIEETDDTEDVEDTEEAPLDTPMPPPSPASRNRSGNPLVLASVLLVIFGAVGGLIGYSLWSYFSDGGSILDPGIAPTPTMPNDANGSDEATAEPTGNDGAGAEDTASVDADAVLLEADEKAESASTLARTAQSGDDWDLVVNQWERAIALTETVPEENPQYAIAQQRLADYRANLANAQQQADVRANVESAPLPSTVVTMNEEAVQCLDVAATAESQAVELTNVRFDIPSDESTTTQIVGCITNHSDQAIASATINYTGASTDDPEATVEGRGELNFSDLEPGTTVEFRGNFELPASLNTVEIGGITWLPTGSTESQSIEISLALTNDQ